MTKENALAEAKKVAKKSKLKMVIVNDPIANNAEDAPDGPWGYCPAIARQPNGKLTLYPWAVEIIPVN